MLKFVYLVIYVVNGFAKKESWHIDECSSVIFFALEVLALDQIIDLLFDHLWIGAEHTDISNDIGGELDHFIGLLGLHHLDSLRLDYICSFTLNLHECLLFLCGWLSTLLLYLLLRDENVTDLLRR